MGTLNMLSRGHKLVLPFGKDVGIFLGICVLNIICIFLLLHAPARKIVADIHRKQILAVGILTMSTPT